MHVYCCIVWPCSQVYIAFVDTSTTPAEAVELFITFIKRQAIAIGGKCATYVDTGNEIPLHYQNFTCNQEQKFAVAIAGDRRSVIL